ncbi:MAG: exopolyphosphatase [Burkholderiales bacterium]|jgi:nanoRNase/pAp phosphatase (c-di-AMP/oligoRNAs hydrolase)
MSRSKYRLVTRSDFDGLVCAVLLKELDLIDDILFVHPKDMQDGRVEIGPRDITTNLPYVAAAHLVFDHHASEMIRNTSHVGNHVIDPDSPSAARVVWHYYGGADAFPRVDPELMRAVDQADSARYSLEEVLHPKDWTLLNFLMDARTGLGRFRDFRISNYQLMMALIDACRTMTVGEILAMPDVRERVDLYFQHEPRAVDQLLAASTSHGNVVVVDLRDQDPIWATNRFMVYALFPQCNLSIHRMWGLKRQNTVFAIGRSIFERTCATDVGSLCLRYGGGGHAAAGTCQIEHSMADRVLEELIAVAQKDEAERLQRTKGA